MPTRLISLDREPDSLVEGQPVLIGRHDKGDVRIESIRTSRRHCFLAEHDWELIVYDLDSGNGTTVNGRSSRRGWSRATNW